MIDCTKTGGHIIKDEQIEITSFSSSERQWIAGRPYCIKCGKHPLEDELTYEQIVKEHLREAGIDIGR